MATSRKRLFVHHFLAGAKSVRGNQRAAALAAGYKNTPNLDDTLSDLRRDPDVQERIKKHFDRLDLVDERILAEQCRIAFANITDVFEVVEVPAVPAHDGEPGRGGFAEIRLRNLDELPPEIGAAIQEIKPVIDQRTGDVYYSIKMHEKKSALEFLAKARGLIKTPDINILVIQALAGLDLSAYTTEELQTLQRLIQRGMNPAQPQPAALPVAPPHAKNVTPRPPDLPQNGAGH